MLVVKPRISICIPVYNTRLNYLDELLASIASQSIKDFEVVIRDDKSSYNYTEIIEKYKQYFFIDYAINDVNLGMVGNWNATVLNAKGEYVVVTGHDDAYEKDFIKNYIAIIDGFNDVSIIGSRCKFVNEFGVEAYPKNIFNHRDNIFVKEGLYKLEGGKAAKLCLRNGAAAGELSVLMFKKNDFVKSGCFDNNFLHAADLALSLQMMELGDLVYINKPLVIRRIHKGNLTWANLKTGKITDDREKIFTKFSKKFPFTSEEIDGFRAYIWAAGLYDIIRFFQHRSFYVLEQAIQNIVKYWPRKLTTIRRFIYELRSGQNTDAEWVVDYMITNKNLSK